MYLCIKIQESQQDMDKKKSLTVKDWANEDKPREKMLNQGAKQLTNAELIAILLRSGLVGKSVLDVAKEILQSADNSLSTLSRMDYKQLRTVKGLGDAKATTLMAALELGWRLQSEINTDRQLHLPDSTAMFNYMLPTFASLDHEEPAYLHRRTDRHVGRPADTLPRRPRMQSHPPGGGTQPPRRHALPKFPRQETDTSNQRSRQTAWSQACGPHHHRHRTAWPTRLL